MKVKLNPKIISLILLILYSVSIIFLNKIKFFVYFFGTLIYIFVPSINLIKNLFKKSKFNLYEFMIVSFSLNLIILTVGLLISNTLVKSLNISFLYYLWFVYLGSLFLKKNEFHLKIKKIDLVFLGVIIISLLSITIFFQNIFYRNYDDYVVLVKEDTLSFSDNEVHLTENSSIYIMETIKGKENITLYYFNKNKVDVKLSTFFKLEFNDEGNVYYSLNNKSKKIHNKDPQSIAVDKETMLIPHDQVFLPRHNIISLFSENYKNKRSVIVENYISLKPGLNSLFIFTDSEDKEIKIVDLSSYSTYDIYLNENQNNRPLLNEVQFITAEETYYWCLFEANIGRVTMQQPPIGYVIYGILMVLTERSFSVLNLVPLLCHFFIFLTIIEIIKIKNLNINIPTYIFLILIIITCITYLIYDFDLVLQDSIFSLFYIVFIYSLLKNNLKLVLISSFLTSGTRFPGVFLIICTLISYYILFKEKRKEIVKIIKSVFIAGSIVVILSLILLYFQEPNFTEKIIDIIYIENIPEHYATGYKYSFLNFFFFIISILTTTFFIPILSFFKKEKISNFLILSIIPYFIIISSVSWPRYRYFITFVFVFSITGLIGLNKVKKKWVYLLPIIIFLWILYNLFVGSIENFILGTRLIIFKKILFNVISTF